MGLSLKLLGEFAVLDETGKALSLPTRKTRALLAYLAVNADKPQQRDRLMALLWGDRGERQARHSLNQALMAIRRLGSDAGVTLLDGEGERVTLLGNALAIDLADFHDQLTTNAADAATLYEGPFLDGINISEPAFENWLALTRSEIHDQVCDALAGAADQATDDGDIANAINLLRRLIALDPLREDAHRRLMRLLHENADRAGALRQYQACAEILKKELQVDPDAATKSLFEEIRKDSSALAEPTMTPPTPEVALTEGIVSPLEKPFIAVLPFENLSGDPDQEFFADGMAEDIITDLSRFRWFSVIARNSSFTYKGRAVDVKQIARELGVRYVLAGSVRKVGNRVRVAVQLIDASIGTHIWAERYDQELNDVFTLQDEITETIVAAIEPELSSVERERARRKPPENLDAWGSYQRGIWHHIQFTRDHNAEAQRLYCRSIELDPNFASAYARLAHAKASAVLLGFVDERNQILEDARKNAEQAIALNAKDPLGHYALGRVQSLLQEHDHAIAKLNVAIELNPNFAHAHFGLAQAYYAAGEVERVIPEIETAIRLSPRDPSLWSFLSVGARAHLTLRQYDEAITWARRAQQQTNTEFGRASIALISALGHLDRLDEAKTVLAQVRQHSPRISIRSLIQGTVGHFKVAAQREHILAGLRKAGLPE